MVRTNLRRTCHAILIIGLASTGEQTRSQVSDSAQATAPALQEFAEVVVTGEQPGPALWRVQSGEHVLWLLGGVSQLPGKVTWRSKQLEAVLSGSQEGLLDQGGPS